MNHSDEARVRRVIESLNGSIVAGSHAPPTPTAVVAALKDVEAGREIGPNMARYIAMVFELGERTGEPCDVEAMRIVYEKTRNQVIATDPIENDNDIAGNWRPTGIIFPDGMGIDRHRVSTAMDAIDVVLGRLQRERKDAPLTMFVSILNTALNMIMDQRTVESRTICQEIAIDILKAAPLKHGWG